MINWSKYFDHIFILSRCSNFELRENLNQEFKRIGLYDYITYLYQPDSELLNYQSSSLSKSVYRCKYAHYSCIKMAYELGYDNVCILEDDIIFLKNIYEIENQLNIFLENKSNSDIYLFDYINNDNTEKTYFTVYYCTDFYWINKHGMEFLINMNETYLDLPCDSFFLPSFNNPQITQYLIYPSNKLDGICIDFSNKDLLPININISPIRICIQKNNYYENFNNQIDKSLYNIINWKKYFDHIFILSRCSNFERRENLNRELKRIGLYDYVTYLYQPDSELLDYQDSSLSKPNYRCKYAHYSCIKMAYELGYNNVCILEDDMIFLKDISEIENQLNIFLKNKNNSDIYLFDYIKNDDTEKTVSPIYYLADFYWINRHGMEYMIYMLETYPKLMNDSLFIANLSNPDYQYFCLFPGNSERILIDLTKTNLLPINIKTSENRICIQSNNINYEIFNNKIDKSLYNL